MISAAKTPRMGLLSSALLGASGLVLASASLAHETAHDALPSGPLFERAEDVIPFEEGPRRSWGGPVIADLDGDGRDDIITTAHGHAANIYWNEGGTYSGPTRLIPGDTHGLGVADYDKDGRVDIVIARGGGDGGNPRRPVMFTVNPDRSIEDAVEFDFFERGRGRSVKFIDVDQDSDLDLIVTGFAPNNVANLSTNQLYINTDGAFAWHTNLPRAADALSFFALTTDFNDDGDIDFITYGGGTMIVLQGGEGSSFSDVTEEVMGDLARIGTVSSLTEIDYDNDGDLDLFVTRAPLQFAAEQYYDSESQRFAFFSFREAFLFDEVEIEGDLILENLQETYAARGVFLGEDAVRARITRTDGHAGGSLRVRPREARGWPEEGTQLGSLHIGYLGQGKWRIGGVPRSRLAGVINNVQSSPASKKRPPMPARLLENRGGRFVDVSDAMGSTIAEQTEQAVAGDFNNDGWVDLAVVRYGNRARPVRHAVLMNNGGTGFSQHRAHGVVSTEVGATGNAIEAFDYDGDGYLDLLFGHEAGYWHLMRNSGQERGNFFVVNVGRSPEAHAAPTGARIDLSACGIEQRRPASANGDGFHTSLNTRTHFGLGSCAKVDWVKVTWPNGEVAVYRDQGANQEIGAGLQKSV